MSILKHFSKAWYYTLMRWEMRSIQNYSQVSSPFFDLGVCPAVVLHPLLLAGWTLKADNLSGGGSTAQPAILAEQTECLRARLCLATRHDEREWGSANPILWASQRLAGFAPIRGLFFFMLPHPTNILPDMDKITHIKFGHIFLKTLGKFSKP